MSRFLGSFRRLKKRVEKARAARMDVGEAMRHLALTGEWPKNKELRAEVEMMQGMARRMAATIPSRPRYGEGETVH